MIREIINFTRDLLADIPDIRHWNAKPDKGLHVFIDIDDNGQWVNKELKEGVDYAYYDGENGISSCGMIALGIRRPQHILILPRIP